MPQTSFDSGDIEIPVKSSSGTKVELYVNENLISTETFLSPVKEVYIDDNSISGTFQIGIGSKIRFINNGSNQIKLNISDANTYKTLNLGEFLEFSHFEAESLMMRDEVSSKLAQITVIDLIIQKNYSVDQNKLQDGANSYKAIIKSLQDDSKLDEITGSFDYNLYTNQIMFSNYSNITTKRDVKVSGYVTDPNDHLAYVLNFEGQITNLGMLNQISLDGNNFSTVISGLNEGNNSIRFITLDKDNNAIFTGQKRANVFVDSFPPTIKVESVEYRAKFGNSQENVILGKEQFGENVYLNGRQLTINVSVDAKEFLVVNNLVQELEDYFVGDEAAFKDSSYVETVEIFPRKDDNFEFLVTFKGEIDTFTYEYNGLKKEVSVTGKEDIRFTLKLAKTNQKLKFNYKNTALGKSVTEDVTIDSKNIFEVKQLSSKEYPVVNNSVTFKLSLTEGQNNITFIAFDRAGNQAKEAHAIHFSDKPVQLKKETLDPKSGNTVHFFVQDIKGQVTKAGATVTVFAIPDNAVYYDEVDGKRVEKTATCKDYDFIGFSRVANVLGSGTNSQINQKPQGVQVSLLDLLSDKVTVESDSEGNFRAKNVVLLDKSLSSSDVEGNEVGSVASSNTICYILSDKFGNVVVDSSSLTLDTGNTMWSPGKITTTPNTIYSAEIEQLSNSNTANDGVRFGVIAEFKYHGGGDIKSVSGVSLGIDRSFSDESQHGTIVQSEMNYVADKDSNTLTVYFPVEVEPMGIPPLEYPSELKFGYQMHITYELEDKDIPIDTRNPVYFQMEVNVENPLDHTKWLTPEMINKTLQFLEKSINFTKKLATYTSYATVGGVLACTGAKFYIGAQIGAVKANKALSDSERQQQISDLTEKLYYICDRTACSASPQECNGGSENFKGSGVLNVEEGKTAYTGTDLLGVDVIGRDEDSNKVLASFDNLKLGNPCDYNGDGKADDGVLVSSKVTRFENVAGEWNIKESKSVTKLNNKCVPAQYDMKGIEMTGVDEKGNKIHSAADYNKGLQKADLKGISGACYNDKYPKFDNTRCLNKAGWNPADNIIESIGCGCITDTYSHLNKFIKIQEGIQNCLKEAQIGVAKGSYCERLMGIAVCDVATNILFKTVSQKSVRGNTNTGDDPHSAGIGSFLSGAQQMDQVLEDRYEGNEFYTRAGLSTEQITNKVCLVALTGDWSALTTNLLSAIEENQVKPTFGPMFPTSRMQGYNPFTGDLSIRYIFTYAGVSGGQDISTKVSFICDKSQMGGEYCPDDIVSSDSSGSSISVKHLRIGKGGSTQDTITATDTKARFRYNIVRLEHTYQLNEQTITEVQEENINHKGELFGQCHWNGGLFGAGLASGNLGIVCDAVFSGDSLISGFRIIQEKSFLAPKRSNPTYYPGNNVVAHLGLDLRGLTGNSFDLAYKVECSGTGEGQQPVINYKPINLDSTSGSISGADIQLFTIPSQLGAEGTQATGEFMTYSLVADKVENDEKYYLAFYNNQAESALTGNVKSASSELSNFVGGVRIGEDISRGRVSSKELKGSDINGKTLTLDFDSQTPSGMSIVLVDGMETIVGTFQTTRRNLAATTELTYLQAGNCKLSVRAVQSGDGPNVISSVENFENYNPLGENIDTNVNAKDDIATFSFTVAQTPSSPSFSFGLIKPTKDNILCIDDSFKARYFALSSSNSGNYNIEADLSPSRFTYSATAKSSISVNQIGYLDFRFDGFDFSQLEDEPRQEVSIRYTVKDNSNGEVQRGTVTFYGQFRQSCSGYTQAGAPETPVNSNPPATSSSSGSGNSEDDLMG